MPVIELEKPCKWPNDLREYLDRHHNLFVRWETEPSGVTGAAYDWAIRSLRVVLNGHALIGWHCTRLTGAEAAAIQSDGMRLPDAAMLHRRIDAAAAAGMLSPVVAARLKAEHQADEPWRAGMVWFCFYPPRLAGESGIERFFRHWGGEALYNSHEDDPETGAAIRLIGTPCMVEAEVPIASLRPHGGLAAKVARRHLVSRGHRTAEPLHHEDAVVLPLAAANIRRIVPFPSPEFVALTGCEAWRRPIAGAGG